MAAVSRIPATQDKVKQVLAARPALSGVQITVGEPSDPRPIEYIVVSSVVTDWRQEYVTPELKQEDFTLPVHVFAQRFDAYAVARDRAFLIAAEVEAELRSNPTLTNTDWDVKIAGGSTGEIQEDEQHGCVVTFDLACTSELTAT